MSASVASLEIEIVDSENLAGHVRAEILALCMAAYDEDLDSSFRAMGPARHVIGRIAGRIVSHAAWVTRWLQVSNATPMRTAYVEAVATLPDMQRSGYATEIMRRIVDDIPAAYELAALSPATDRIYGRLGWYFWRGPLSVRMPDGALEATPEERIMIYDLPGRRKLSVDAPLSVEWRAGEVW